MGNGTHELLIDFGVGGNSNEFCRDGWSQPEPRHTWTLGQQSTLELPQPDEPGDYRMVLELGPFVAADRLPCQHLEVLANGTEIGAFEVNAVSLLECLLPWSVIEPKKTISITFLHPNAAKPSEVNGVPDHREIAFALERLRLTRVSGGGASGAERAGTPVPPENVALPPDQLMMQFESLGENCEFGLVQRRCGAEPLGLLRFASAPLPRLLAALRARFAGLGDPGHIEVQVSPDQSEYLVIDSRFGLLYHPWVRVGEAAPEEIRQRETVRLPFLRRKMLEDLEEARKIFVYHGMDPLSEAEVLRLLEALRAYGPATLLWVDRGDARHQAGTVEVAAPGLLKAYIDRFAPGDNAHDFSSDAWLEICRKAYRLVHSSPSAP
jgi:hypothetical protein